MRLIARYDYREGVKIPKSGPLIVVSNHVSYMDAFALAFFLYSHGRTPRFLGKSLMRPTPGAWAADRPFPMIPIEPKVM